MESEQYVRLSINCLASNRQGIKAIANLEGKTTTRLINEIMSLKIQEYPEIYNRVTNQSENSNNQQSHNRQASEN